MESKVITTSKPKIGIYTTFSNLNSEYSLATVVKQQIIMLSKYGYEVVLFVLQNFNDSVDYGLPSGVEIRAVLPQLILEPYGARDITNLDTDVSKVQEALEKHMLDIDVCLTHDIIFINTYLPYNIAMRKAINTTLGHVKWLHWMHSGSSHRQIDDSVWDNLYTLPENSRLVFMNNSGAIGAAEMYGVFPDAVRVISNPMDMRDTFNFHELTRELIDAYGLMKADIIINYPLSVPRMGDDGKQLSKVIWIAAEIKELGLNVKVVVPSAHANADKEKHAIKEMLKFAVTCGLDTRDVVFTSMHDTPKWEHGIPHRVVTELFKLANVFIFPSVSENCPLILLEAMLGKNLLVLNKSFTPMYDFALKNALYFEFGSVERSVSYNNGMAPYFEEVAKLIVNEFENNKALMANNIVRQKFNVDYIFKRQLEPAILELYNNEY